MPPEKPGLKDRLQQKLEAVRRRCPFVDHVVRMHQHYGLVHGSILAGAVTYFGFLSFFPILALGFAVIGYVAVAYPDAEDSLVTAIQQIFPNIVTTDGAGNTISIQQIANAKAAAGLIGLAGLLYSGLGWLSGLRDALTAAFELPPSEKRNLVVGKGIDLIVLMILGLVMIVSVGMSGAVKGLASTIIDWLGVPGLLGGPLIYLIGVSLGVAASTLLLFVMYRLLAGPKLPARALWQGAFLGAVGFEVLKYIVVNILGGIGGSAFAPLAIAITLVVWINYFSRLVMYGASWAMTSPLRGVGSDELDVEEAKGAPARPKHRAAVPTLAGDGVAPAGPDRVVVRDEEPDDSEHLGGRIDPGSVIIGVAAGALAGAVAARRHQ
jgi:membrane protein